MNLHVLNTEGPRFELALERLVEGYAFDYRNVTFGFSSSRHGSILEILVRTSLPIQAVTRETALEDLQFGEYALKELTSKSMKFAKLVKDYDLRFVLIHDYQTGVVELCRLIDEELIWAKGMEDRGHREC